MIDECARAAFIKTVKDWYACNRRDFPWRNDIIPYRVLVSEIMLQQTQTDRVIDKFNAFIELFPTIFSLANASQSAVLGAWNGLGYNRRALYLHKTACELVGGYNGVVPDEPALLKKFAGIGDATAASIVAFAYNKPTTFIETNLRTVFIYHFFKDDLKVTDAMILPLITATIDHIAPREWYYALMDYGVMLKKSVGNISKQSAHYAVQKKFNGSDRQIRGAIVRLLLAQKRVIFEVLSAMIHHPLDERLNKIIVKLQDEGFLIVVDQTVILL